MEILDKLHQVIDVLDTIPQNKLQYLTTTQRSWFHLGKDYLSGEISIRLKEKKN